jgi:hypothetical protein
MRKTKLAAALAALTMTAGATAALVGSPAQAATAAATTAKLSYAGHAKIKGQYGDLIGFLSASVTDTAGNPVDGGTTTLQAKAPGKGWKVVKTDTDAADGVDVGSVGSHAKGNVQYRLHYLGDAAFAPSFSKVVIVTTLWNFKDTSACPNGHCHISGKLIPKTKNHKILVQVKHGSWKKFKVLHTSAKGTYRVNVTGSRKGTKYRIIIAATKNIVATRKGYVVTLI